MLMNNVHAMYQMAFQVLALMIISSFGLREIVSTWSMSIDISMIPKSLSKISLLSIVFITCYGNSYDQGCMQPRSKGKNLPHLVRMGQKNQRLATALGK